MIGIDDLTWLEPDYLRAWFRPEANGISPEELAIALRAAAPETQRHLLAHVPPDLGARLRLGLGGREAVSPDQALAARAKVIGVYFWEVVYRKHADIYDQFSQSQRFPFDALFPLERFRGATVLDVGCGTGKLTAHFVGVARKVIGVDPSVPMLEVARRKLGSADHVTFRQGTFADLPVPDESVDFVVSNMAFQHTEERGGLRGLRSMDRVLRRGGEIRMVVGAAANQDLLLENGFTERFVAGALRCDRPSPEKEPLLLKCLYEIVRADAGTSRDKGPTAGPPYIFSPSRWRVMRSIKALAHLARGATVDETFYRRSFFEPMGVPVFYRVKR